MTKTDYIEQREAIDAQIKAASSNMERLSKDLQRIPSPEDLKSLEMFASKIVSALGENLDVSPEDKR